MIVHIFTSDREHPAIQFLDEIENASHEVSIIDDQSQLRGGQVLIAYHASHIVPKAVFERYTYPLVLHASKLPDGSGWSPLNWGLANGDVNFWLSLIEMTEKVDTGDLLAQVTFEVAPHMLLQDAINMLCMKEIELINNFLVAPSLSWNKRKPITTTGTYLSKRTPQDSEIDITKSLLDQFNVFRAADNYRYPVFFNHLGNKYVLKIFRDEID